MSTFFSVPECNMRQAAWAAIKSVSVLEHSLSKDENVALTDDCR